MPSDAPKKPQGSRPGASSGPAKTPLAMIDALIGGPSDGKPARKSKGRSVLLAHALAQRENRLFAEKRAAASKLNGEPDQPAPAQPATKGRIETGRPEAGRAGPARPQAVRPNPGRPVLAGSDFAGAERGRSEPARPAPQERASLDAVIVKALGASARGHVHDGAFDRESALADLIARTQTRLGTAGKPAPAAVRPAAVALPAFRGGDREAMIAAAIRTHREQQAVFDELSLRQRATLRATAEALIAKSASRG